MSRGPAGSHQNLHQVLDGRGHFGGDILSVFQGWLRLASKGGGICLGWGAACSGSPQSQSSHSTSSSCKGEEITRAHSYSSEAAQAHLPLLSKATTGKGPFPQVILSFRDHTGEHRQLPEGRACCFHCFRFYFYQLNLALPLQGMACQRSQAVPKRRTYFLLSRQRPCFLKAKN